MHTTSSTPKARVRHWCECCSWAIEPGEVYDRWVTFDGGDVLVWKSHVEPCRQVASRARLAGYDDYDGMITSDSIDEWARECHETDELAAEINRRFAISDERRRAKRAAALAGKEGDR